MAPDVTIVRCDHGSTFEITVPTDWRNISIVSIEEQLLNNYGDVFPVSLAHWANQLKYSNPRYKIDQHRERDAAQSVFSEAVSSCLHRLNVSPSQARILLVGSGDGYEIESLPSGLRNDQILAIDPVASALSHAAERYGIAVAQGRIEEITPEYILDLNPSFIGGFDICIALRSLKTFQPNLRIMLEGMRSLIKSSGWIIIGIPRGSINSRGQFEIGVVQKGRIDNMWSDAAARRIEDFLFENPGLFNSIESKTYRENDLERYILAQRL